MFETLNFRDPKERPKKEPKKPQVSQPLLDPQEPSPSDEGDRQEKSSDKGQPEND